MSVARRAGIRPSYVIDVCLAAAERQRTKLESATFPIQTSVDSPRLTYIGMARRARKAW